MSQSTAAYFSNSLVGIPQIGGDVDIYETTATPKFAIGTKMERQDGSIFRYACFGDAVSRGMLVAPDFSETVATGYSANLVITSASTYQQSVERAGLYPNMVGSRYMVINMLSMTANQLAGGYLTVSSGTGLGYTYRIKGNIASSGSACILQLADPLQAAVDNTSDIAIAPSKYSKLKPACAGANSGMPVGVALVTVATSAPFGWIQTKGLVGVAFSGIVTATQLTAVLSDTDIGCAEQMGAGVAAASTGPILMNILATQKPIGVIAVATASSGHALIDLALG